jgi:hypothetical protein
MSTAVDCHRARVDRCGVCTVMLTRPVVLRGGSSGAIDGCIDAVEVEHVMVKPSFSPYQSHE